jgi:hypothetical protein
LHIISVRPLSPTITEYAGSLEETIQMAVTCKTIGSRSVSNNICILFQ